MLHQIRYAHKCFVGKKRTKTICFCNTPFTMYFMAIKIETVIISKLPDQKKVILMEVFLCMPNNPIFTFHPRKCCLHASSTGHGSPLSRTAAQLCQQKQFWNIHLAICCLPTTFANQSEPSKAFTLLRSRNCCSDRAQVLPYL